MLVQSAFDMSNRTKQICKALAIHKKCKWNVVEGRTGV